MKFSQRDFLNFQTVSQDFNPLHEAGLVYGLQLLAYLEGQVELALGVNSVTSLEYHFQAPLFYEEDFELQVTASDFQVYTQTGLIGKGQLHGS